MSGGSDHRSRREAWAAFRRLLSREYPDYADRIQILLESGHALVRGEIESEDAKAWLLVEVSHLPGVVHVIDDLVVAAPLTPAMGWDPFDDPVADRRFHEPDASRKPVVEGTDIVRFPAIDPDGPAVPGMPLTLRLDLRSAPDDATNADPFAITDLEADWEQVEVDVEVHSASLTFAAGANRGMVVVRRGRTSVPFVIVATVNASVAVDLVEVMVVYTFGSRHSGIARRSIEVLRSQSPAGAVPDTDIQEHPSPPSVAGKAVGRSPPHGATRGYLALGLQSDAPTLTLKILRSAEGAGSRYVWTSTSALRVGPANRTGYLDLGDQPASFASRMRSEIVGLRPGQHLASLRGFGQEIWDHAPRDFKDLYWALCDRIGPDFPIQIITDEPHIPWELMQPYDEASGREEEHLYLAHPIARWIGSAEGYLWQDLPGGRIASFAPVYAESEYGLPFAEDEAAWICAELDGIACEPERAEFLTLLCDGWEHGDVAAVHFAGHGSFDESGRNGILMSDGWVSATEVGQTGNRLGARFRSLAVLNACDVGAAAHSLGTMSGWASALAKRRYGGFVAPLWPVSDHHASDVVRIMMRGLYRDHLTLGEAVLKGRQQGFRSSATPFAYVCYGDVMGRVTAKRTGAASAAE